MPNFFRLSLTTLFVFFVNFVQAGITDSLYSIQDDNLRLSVIDYSFHRYPINSKEAKLFREEVLEKGNASEKLIISWMWEDRNLAVSNADSSIAIFDRYLPAAKKINDPNLLAILYSVKANALLSIKKYSSAFENYLFAYENLKKDPQQKYYGQSWLLYNIAMNFYLFRDYPKAIEMSNEVSRLPDPIYYSSGWFRCINYDLIGMAYLHMNKYDSAIYWLDKTYVTADQYKDTAWLGIASGNIGSVYYEQMKYNEAIPYFEKGIAYCLQTSIWDNAAPFSISLAHIYVIKQQLDKAAAFLEIAKDANTKFSQLNNVLKYYNVASIYERAAGNYSKAFELADSARHYEKIADAEFTGSKRALAESQLAYQTKLMENELLQEKAESQQWRSYGLAIILTLALIAFLLFIKRQRLQHSLQQKILQNEKLTAEKELSLALYEIKEFTVHTTEKNKAIAHLLQQIEHLKEEKGSISQQDVEELEQLNLSTSVTEDTWIDFYQMFEKAFPGLRTKYNEKLPELNEKDIRYLMLTRLDIPPNEIAGMLVIEQKDIAAIRSQLVQKLGLKDEQEIEILLETM
jgi:hypothetical protein